MPIEKIEDDPFKKMCRDAEHKPPSLISLSPGTYRHTCPRCGEETVFVVRGAYL